MNIIHPAVPPERTAIRRAIRLFIPVGVGLLAIAAPRPSVQAQAPTGSSYRLVDTWRERPWTQAPDRVGSPIDVTSTADGRTIILDSQPTEALHVLGSTPDASRVIDLPDGLRAVHIDAGGDAGVAVLTADGWPRADVAWVDLATGAVRRIPLPAPRFLSRYPDITADRDGRVYVAANDRTDEEDEEAAARIYVLRPDGAIEHEIDLRRWYPVDHDAPGHVHPRITAIDVGPDGRLFAALTMVPCT